MPPSIRQVNLLMFLGCSGALLVALYLEHFQGMEPCPLCMTQRIFIAAVGIVALLALLHNPAQRCRRVYAVIAIVLAVAGSYFSSRQLWLQSLPPEQVPLCGPSLSYMFEVAPFMEAFKLLLQGDGNCAEVEKVFGVTIPLWTLLAFIALAALNLYQFLRRR